MGAAQPVCAWAGVTHTHLDVAPCACQANGQPCGEGVKEAGKIPFLMELQYHFTPFPLFQRNSSFLKFLLKPVFGNVVLKQ